MPILSGDAVLGVLNFESRKVGFFQKTDLALLSFLASQVAIALKLVELDRRARVWQDRVSALHNLARLGGGAAPREAVLRRNPVLPYPRSPVELDQLQRDRHLG